MVLTSLAILALLLPTVAFAAPAAPAAEAAPQSSNCSTWHTVRYGETLSHIARFYGVSQQAIMNANGITNPSRIFAGTVLCIPASGGWNPGPGCSTVHVVQRGETLSGIARAYGVSMWAIMEANGILNANHIFVGQRLCIPGGSVVPPQPPTGCTAIYVVQRGDTLAGIARWYGTTVGTLMALNGITNPNHIWVGQRLTVPVPCGDPCPCPPQPPQPPIYPPVQPPVLPPPPISGTWFGEFFNNRDLAGGPTFTGNFEQVGFNWGWGGPGNGVGNDNFSARFVREQWLSAGNYTFYVTSDDGVRVFVNDVLIIDAWKVQSAENYYIGGFNVGDGNARFRIEYFEAEGQAVLFASFARQ
jgi:LysM repeat protein